MATPRPPAPLWLLLLLLLLLPLASPSSPLPLSTPFFSCNHYAKSAAAAPSGSIDVPIDVDGCAATAGPVTHRCEFPSPRAGYTLTARYTHAASDGLVRSASSSAFPSGDPAAAHSVATPSFHGHADGVYFDDDVSNVLRVRYRCTTSLHSRVVDFSSGSSNIRAEAWDGVPRSAPADWLGARKHNGHTGNRTFALPLRLLGVWGWCICAHTRCGNGCVMQNAVRARRVFCRAIFLPNHRY